MIVIRRVREVIVVEGRYDKNAVSQVVEATIIETSGFGVFSDAGKIALLRRLAEKRGLIILTDSDKAGFFIRGRLRGMLDGNMVKHAYLPDLTDLPTRKTTPDNKSKPGVEDARPDVIIMALERARATFEDETGGDTRPDELTKLDLFDAGLSGGAGSAQKRRDLMKRLSLPERLSANSLLDVLNALYTRDEFLSYINGGC